MEKPDTTHNYILVLLIAILVITAYAALKPLNVNVSGNVQQNIITVTGNYEVSVQPDKAEVFLGAETESPTALESQQRNAEIISNIKAALAPKNIPENAVETSSYSLQPVYDYSDSKNPRLVGYKTIHMLKIKLQDIGKSGTAIDAAVGAGANRVDGVQFSVSNEQEYRSQALREASKNARQKADSIASGLGVGVKKVVQASEGFVNIIPIFVKAAEAASTDISPGQVKITASVSVSYEI